MSYSTSWKKQEVQRHNERYEKEKLIKKEEAQYSSCTSCQKLMLNEDHIIYFVGRSYCSGECALKDVRYL